MALPSVYERKTNEDLFIRLDKIKFDAKPKWGKMDAPKMLAHLNIAYDLAFERIFAKPNIFMKLLIILFIKKVVTNEIPYKQNSPTAPVFIISNEKDFEAEKAKLIANIKEVQSKGAAFFEGKVNQSFGKLTAIEWNNMFYKHLNHHFNQFGV